MCCVGGFLVGELRVKRLISKDVYSFSVSEVFVLIVSREMKRKRDRREIFWRLA